MTKASSVDASLEGLETDVLVRNAVRAFATKRFDKCRALLEVAAKQDPNSLDVALWSVRLAQKSADWSTLKVASDRWLALEPDSLEARQALAEALGGLNFRAAAAALWTEIAGQRPDDLDSLGQSVRFNRSVGRSSRAEACIKNSLRVTGEDDELRIDLARTLIKSGDLVGARTLLADIATRTPARADRLLHEFLDREETVVAAVLAGSMGSVKSEHSHELSALAETVIHEAVRREADGAFDQAFLGYSALLLMDPADELARRGQKRILEAQTRAITSAMASGDLIRAAEASYDLLSCEPESAHALLHAAHIAVLREENSEGRLLWDTILERGIVAPEAMRAAAKYFEHIGDYRLAYALYEKAGSARPDGKDLAERFSRKLIQIGRSMSAADRLVDAARALSAVPSTSAHFEEAVRRNRQISRAFLTLLRDLYRSNELRSVIDQGLEALNLYPDDFDINRMVARAASKSRDHELAQRQWSILVSHPEAASEALLGLARSAYALRRWAECTGSALALLESDPDHAEARKLLEASRRKLGPDAN